MTKLFALAIAALLTACGAAGNDGSAYLGTWSRKNDPGYQVVIVAGEGRSYLITWHRALPIAGRPVSKQLFDATLVDGKLVSQGMTTFLREDGVLVFGHHEYVRKP